MEPWGCSAILFKWTREGQRIASIGSWLLALGVSLSLALHSPQTAPWAEFKAEIGRASEASTKCYDGNNITLLLLLLLLLPCISRLDANSLCRVPLTCRAGHLILFPQASSNLFFNRHLCVPLRYECSRACILIMSLAFHLIIRPFTDW